MKTAEQLGEIYRHELKREVEGFERRRRSEARRPLFIMLVAAATVIPLSLLLPSDLRATMAIGSLVLISILALIYHSWAWRRFKRDFKTQILARLIREMEPGLSYEATGFVGRELIEASGFFMNRSIDSFGGEDYISGSIDGMDIEFSELRLTRRSSGNSNNNRNSVIFEGFFLVATVPTPFAGKTQVVPDVLRRLREHMGGSMLGSFAMTMLEKFLPPPPASPFETGDTAFDELFLIDASDQAEARRLLDDDLRARLLAINEQVKPDYRGAAKSGDVPMIYFACRGNRIFIAVSSQQDLFDLSPRGTLLSFEVVKQFVTDFQMAMSVVEAARDASQP